MATVHFCASLLLLCVLNLPATPEMGWFLKKKKKSNPQDSIKVKNEYEKLTGSR